MADHLTATLASGTCCPNAQKPCTLNHLTQASARIAGFGLFSGLNAAAGAGVTLPIAAHGNFGLAPVYGFQKVDFDPNRQIAATPHPSSTRSASSKQVTKHVREVAENILRTVEARIHSRTVQTGVAKTVVRGPFFSIRKHRVRLRRFLKQIFRSSIIRVFVRMMLHCQFSVCLFDFCI
jgi:hypothetical protein